MRIVNHPILGVMKPRKRVYIKVDGNKVEALEGESILAVLLANGIRVCRYTKKRNEPRRLFCAIGRCTDCVMTVDGVPNVRTCVTLAEEGMSIETQRGLGKWGKDSFANSENIK